MDEVIALLGHLTPDEVAQIAAALRQPGSQPQMQLAEAFGSEGALQEAYAAMIAASAMPEDAAARWGLPVAMHRCAKRDGNCLAKPAREEATVLDELHARLERAKRRAEGSARIDAAVPLRDNPVLAHKPGSSVQSAVQAAAAAAAAEQAVAHAHESPVEAAMAVRTSLQAYGCCNAAEKAFLGDYVGRSNNFMYYCPSAKGHRANKETRRAGVQAKRELEHLPSCDDIYESVCCPHFCSANISAAALEDWRSRYVGAADADAKLSVVKQFLWDDGQGQLRGYCDDFAGSLFPVGAEQIRRLERAAQGDECAAPVRRQHGMKAYAAAHPPPNKTPPEVEAKVLRHWDLMTMVAPDTIKRKGAEFKYRKANFFEHSNMPQLTRHYNESEAATETNQVSERIYCRIVTESMRKEGIRFFYSITGDHNVCRTCKKLAEATRAVQRQIAAKQGCMV